MDGISDDQWRRWAPASQEKALNALREVAENKWRPFYCPKPKCDGLPHDRWGFPHARYDQHPPRGEWLVWLIRGGRGSGKTRSGAEWSRRRTKVSPRIALVAPTGPAARDILVEGESGILACSPPDDRPQWEPSKRKLTWPNGAVGFTYSGEEPDRLRGPQHFDAWLDEPAHMPLIEDVWSNLLFGMRGGRSPRIACTTTPVPSKWMKKLIADPFTVSVAVSTYANIQNLPDHFAKIILERYEGTRLGRQEIHGEILTDVEGALWDWTMIEKAGIEPADAPAVYDRIVVAVDPAGTSHNKSDETGIIVLGSADRNFYVLDDRSGRFKPNVWANRVNLAYAEYDADVIVAEDNYGGEMVESTIAAACDDPVKPRIKRVNSRRGKIIRADPVVALYEQNRVFHVGMFNDLEDQLTSWIPGSTSPDRLDALVHGIHELAHTVAPSSVADPSRLRVMRPFLRRVFPP